MSDFLIKLLEEIKQGIRTGFNDIDLFPDEYLEMDENGKTFLEKIFDLGIKLNSYEEEKLELYIEAAYIYAKYNKNIYNFKFEEADLFSNLNDIRYIDYFAENYKLTPDMIRSIKENIEIIDILIQTDNLFYIADLSNDIIKKLLIQDKEGKYPLEKYLNNEKVIFELINLIYNPEKLIEILKKNNRLDLLKEANNIVLLYKINEKETVFDILYNQNIIPTVLKKIPRDTFFVKLLRERKLYEYLKKADEDILLFKDEKGKTLLEELIENGYVPEMEKEQINVETIKVLYKIKRLDIASCIADYILVKSVNEVFGLASDKTVLEYILDLGYNPVENATYFFDDLIIKILYKRGFYSILGKTCNERQLLIEIEQGITLIDKLLEKNIPIELSSGFSSKQLAEKLYETNNMQLLSKGKVGVLLRNVDSNNTYLDYILMDIQTKKIKVNLNEISLYKCSNGAVAKFYLTLAKYDMVPYVDRLTEDRLLEKENGVTLLENLLCLDSDLTLNKVISSEVKKDMKVAVVLKSLGFEQKEVNIPLETEVIPTEYLEEQKNKLFAGPLLNEGEYLLNKLQNLFLSDGESEINLVETLINAYRNALFLNHNLAIKELRNLVKIKKKNIKEFVYKVNDDNTCFNRGIIYSEYPILGDILHETGHALHSYLLNYDKPAEYDEAVIRVRQNPETIKKVESFSKEYNKIKKEAEEYAKKRCEEFFKEYYTEEKIKNIELFLTKSKQEKKEELSSLGLSESDLDVILNVTLTVEEYIEHQKRIYINELKHFILSIEFSSFASIADILDAIYEGELHSGVLKNEHGEKIEKTAGHGIQYYSLTKHGFDEIVADFATIVKSKNSEEMLKLLNHLIGDELYQLISEFYYNSIVESKYEDHENRKSL